VMTEHKSAPAAQRRGRMPSARAGEAPSNRLPRAEARGPAA
jgi:hypothetical protein